MTFSDLATRPAPPAPRTPTEPRQTRGSSTGVRTSGALLLALYIVYVAVLLQSRSGTPGAGH